MSGFFNFHFQPISFPLLTLARFISIFICLPVTSNSISFSHPTDQLNLNTIICPICLDSILPSSSKFFHIYDTDRTNSSRRYYEYIELCCLALLAIGVVCWFFHTLYLIFQYAISDDEGRFPHRLLISNIFDAVWTAAELNLSFPRFRTQRNNEAVQVHVADVKEE